MMEFYRKFKTAFSCFTIFALSSVIDVIQNRKCVSGDRGQSHAIGENTDEK